VHWFEKLDACPVTGNKLVLKNTRNHLNTNYKYAFLETCYQQPIAVWPYDPLNKLDDTHPLKHAFHIINRNQEQTA
jgi:hypothetical protein